MKSSITNVHFIVIMWSPGHDRRLDAGNLGAFQLACYESYLKIGLLSVSVLFKQKYLACHPDVSNFTSTAGT